MESNNPAFNPRTLEKMRSTGAFDVAGRTMTVEGTINKVGILVTLTVLTSALSWSFGESGVGSGAMVIAAIINLILGNFKFETKCKKSNQLNKMFVILFISKPAIKKSRGKIQHPD